MVKCRRMKRPQFMSKNWISSWRRKSSRIRQQFYRLESFAMNTDAHMNGSTVKNHITLKTVFGYSVIRKTSYLSWFLVYQQVLPQAFPLQHPWHRQGRKLIMLHLPQARLLHQPWHLKLCQATVRLEHGETRADRSPSRNRVKWTCGKARTERPLLFWNFRRVVDKKTKIQKPNKKEDHEQVRGDPCHSDIPEWLQEFRENVVDDEVPEHRNSRASSSHGLSFRACEKCGFGKHSVKTHFPKDRHCEICQRTNITRAPCRRRIGRVVPRAENYGDLITADHKVSVKVVNLETIIDMHSWCRLGHSMDSVVSVQNKNCSGNPEKLAKVLGTREETLSHLHRQFLGIRQSWWRSFLNNCTSTPHRSETNGIAERAVRRVKVGTSAVLLQSGLDEKWWADSMECYLSARHSRSLVWWGRLHTKGVLENLLMDQ